MDEILKQIQDNVMNEISDSLNDLLVRYRSSGILNAEGTSYSITVSAGKFGSYEMTQLIKKLQIDLDMMIEEESKK